MASNHLLRVEGPGCHSRPPDQDGHHSCLQLVVDMVMNTSTAGYFRMAKLSATETQPGGRRQGLYTTALDKLHTQRWSLWSNDHYGMTSSQRGCISAECQHTLGRPGGCSSRSVSEQHKLLEVANTGMFIVGGFPGHQTAGITCQIQTLANRLS